MWCDMIVNDMSSYDMIDMIWCDVTWNEKLFVRRVHMTIIERI